MKTSRRNTLSIYAIDGAPNQPRGIYRKVSVGRIGIDAEIIWEYKVLKEWKKASTEKEAKFLCLARSL
jgi:hypothetical protein